MPSNMEEDDDNHLDQASPFSINYAEEYSINNAAASNAFPHASQSPAIEPKHAAPTFLARLSQLPMQRPLPWREGQELPADRYVESQRVQQRGACLLATRGTVSNKPCTACAAGRGRFTHCITLGNWFQGACSSCIFTSKGNRCSLRLQRGKVDGRAARHQRVEEGGMVDGPKPKKRKRRAPVTDSTIANTINKNPSRSPFQLPTAASPQTASPDMDSLLQAEIARKEPTGLLGYVHKMEKKQKRNHNKNERVDMSHNGLPRYNKTCGLMHGYSEFLRTNNNQSSTAGSKPPQNVWPQQPSIKNPPLRPAPAPPQGKDPTIPLIDTLPKSKQRQIFGLVNGLQGGIDHLQKQLNLLQSSLGIEDETRYENDI